MSTFRRASYWYMVSLTLMTIYGGQVCPFIDTLPPRDWALLLAGAYAGALVLRSILEQRLVCSRPEWERGRIQFRLDMALMVGLGLSVALFDMAVLHFPLESGAKVLLGTFCLGFFTALDMTLEREYLTAAHARTLARQTSPLLPFHSLAVKAGVLASLVVGFNTAVVGLVVTKDILLLRSLPVEATHLQTVYVAVEIVFTGLVLLGLTLRVLWSYARNLQFNFTIQTEAMESVGKGDLDAFVPIYSSDEFGKIASDTNSMIDGLKEKERIRAMFGKFLDPRAADRLMARNDMELKLGGTRTETAILISDIRDFTAAGEVTPPETLLDDLNAYFTAGVKAVASHGGMVDKFIGDGMLALFGIGDETHGTGQSTGSSTDRAMRAAVEILEGLDETNKVLSRPIRIGIGLHFGSVVCGLMGSPERLEFTVIGDAVNTAARLESLSKVAGPPLIVSETFRRQLTDPELVAMLSDLGDHQLKGKSESVRVWGWDPKQARADQGDSP